MAQYDEYLSEVEMSYISTGMGDRFSVLLVFLMALRLILVDQKPFWPCYLLHLMKSFIISHLHKNLEHDYLNLKFYIFDIIQCLIKFEFRRNKCVFEC